MRDCILIAIYSINTVARSYHDVAILSVLLLCKIIVCKCAHMCATSHIYYIEQLILLGTKSVCYFTDCIWMPYTGYMYYTAVANVIV